MMMFSKILIANRGEIACRVIKTARRMGIKTVAVYSDADRCALHVRQADEAVHIGASPVGESYLKADKIIQAALQTGAQAIHPGYGFLSENPDFVDAVERAGLVFIGPSADSIRAMGLKDAAKALMIKSGVPVVPGYHGREQSPEFLMREADKIGYPVLIKARAGGGGKGMRLVERQEDFIANLQSASREGQSAFGDPAVLIEKFITSPRHIEVQVLGDSHGRVLHFFERDCSLQRRHQKVIEEAPAPGMSDDVRKAITGAAVKAAEAIHYQGAGTIEFIVDGSGPLRTDGFWFMEMNTRLQVEHPVTEAITGHDLVELQIRVAAGEALVLEQSQIELKGHSFEARLYAENVNLDFMPTTGKLEHLVFYDQVRNDSGVQSGDEITPFYDPMIAKIISYGSNRGEALRQLQTALSETFVAGTLTNMDFLQSLARHEEFVRGNMDTSLIAQNIDALTDGSAPDEVAIAMAMSVALGINPTDPDNGWRQWGEARHRMSLQLNDQIYHRYVVLEGNGCIRTETLEENTICSQLQNLVFSDGMITSNIGDLRTSARFVSFENRGKKFVSIHKDGHAFEFLIPDLLSRSASVIGDDSTILAPMTGIAIVIDRVAGDHVKQGDRLMVMEAMKMEMNLTALRDGIIAQIMSDVGASVEGGTIVARLEDNE